MVDTSHLVALNEGLSHARGRLAAAKSERERALRTVWVAQYQREIDAEMRFLGMDVTVPDISDDDLLAELQA